jgi:hypothetical protein
MTSVFVKLFSFSLLTYWITWLIVLGPNHSPMFFPSCLPSSAMRWIEKGARGDSSSRNQCVIYDISTWDCV